jgi:hypothetical protein
MNTVAFSVTKGYGFLQGYKFVTGNGVDLYQFYGIISSGNNTGNNNSFIFNVKPKDPNDPYINSSIYINNNSLITLDNSISSYFNNTGSKFTISFYHVNNLFEPFKIEGTVSQSIILGPMINSDLPGLNNITFKNI